MNEIKRYTLRNGLVHGIRDKESFDRLTGEHQVVFATDHDAAVERLAAVEAQLAQQRERAAIAETRVRVLEQHYGAVVDAAKNFASVVIGISA